MGEDTPLNTGALEGDARFLLGQIAQVMRDLPARMTRFEQSTSAQLDRLQTGQDTLAAEVRRNSEVLNEKINKVDKDLTEKIDKVDTKTNVITGAITIITSASAGLLAWFMERPHA